MAKNILKSGNVGAFAEDMRLIANHNFSDVSLCDTQLDRTSSTVLTNISGLTTDTLGAGQTYKFSMTIPTVCTANNGSSIAFKLNNGLTLSSIEYEAKAFTASAVAVTRGTTTTDQTLICDNASAVVILIEIKGVIVVNVAGTLQLQAAQHTSHADTFSVYKNAQMQFEHITTG
jgi:hypothetical protein